MKYTKILLTLCIHLFIGLVVRAGNETSTIRLTDSDISQGLIVKDHLYNSGVGSDVIGSVASITLGVEELYQGTRISYYTSTVNLDIKLYNSNGSVTSINNISLNVVYRPDGGSSQKTKDVYFKENYYKMEVVVNSISNSTIPANLYLEGKIETERFYSIGNTSPGSLNDYALDANGSILSQSQVNLGATVSAYDLHWEAVEGAESYQLEYSYIDNYNYDILLDDYSLLLSNQIVLSENDFKNNNTRVVTANTYYRLPAIYPRGYIVYRVRAVGFNMPDIDQPVFTAWSGGNGPFNTVSNWPDKILVKNQIDHDKNYQVVTTFAEEGKKKEVMSFYDGSNRQRQTLTRLNSLEKTVVGETYYDFIGRQSLVLLPVPDNTDVLHYKKDFNKIGRNAGSTSDYPVPSIYDVEAGSACEEEDLVFRNTSGAGLYYDVANYYSNFTDGIPDAQGYVYSKTVYKRDNTGRIKYQSTPGEEFKPGARNTQYHYASPEQAEINALFGDNVGSSSHYKKNLVIDPNGQASVSYLNPAGKTIATAMEGDAPGSMNIIAGNDQNNASPTSITIDVLGKNNAYEPDTDIDLNYLVDDGYALESSQTILVSEAQTYTISYNFGGNSNVSMECYNNMTVPLLLTLEIIDECGDYLLGGVYNKKELSELDFSAGALTLNVPLNIGSYTLVKRLEIDPLELEILHQEYMEQVSTTCFSLEDYLDANLGDIESPCDFCDPNITTPSCKEDIEDVYSIILDYNLSTRLYELNTFPGNPNSIPDQFYDENNNLLHSLFEDYLNEEIVDCENSTGNCDTDPDLLPSSLPMLQMLLTDVGLFGQYGGEKLFDADVDQYLFTKVNNQGVEQLHLNDYTSVWSDARRTTTYNNGVPTLNYSYKNIYNYINLPDPGATCTTSSDYSWKHPNEPLGEIAGHYLDEWGQEYRIYLSGVDSDPLWDGVTGIDPALQTDANGSYMYPEQLASILDFKDHWQEHWAENLVAYHPEFPVYKFYRLLGDPQYFTTTISSEEFDEYLLKDFISGTTGASPLTTMGAHNATNYRAELYVASALKDPLFTLDLSEVFDGADNNEYDDFTAYYNSVTSAMIAILNNLDNLSGYDYENIELNSSCTSNTIDLLDIANYFENCNPYINPTAANGVCSCMDISGNPTLDDGLFQTYITMYISEKQKMIQQLALRYANAEAIKDGYSTYCIGDNSNTYNQDPYGNNPSPFNWYSPVYSPCDYWIKELFDQKIRRILPNVQETSPATSEADEFVSYVNQTEVGIYEETGLSLFTYSLSQFFELLFTQYDVATITSPLSLSDIEGLSPNIFYALGGDNLFDNINNSSFNPSYPDIELTSSIDSNGDLFVTLKEGSTLLRKFKFKITSANHTWGLYNMSGTGGGVPANQWKVTDFTYVVPDSPTTNQLTILANAVCFDYHGCGDQVTIEVESINVGLGIMEMITQLNNNCEVSEFGSELVSLLSLFGNYSELFLGSYNGDFDFLTTPEYTIGELGGISNSLEQLENTAYYQLSQSNGILDFFGSIEQGYIFEYNGTNSLDHDVFTFGVLGNTIQFSIIESSNDPFSTSSIYSESILVQGAYEFNSDDSIWEYKGALKLFRDDGSSGFYIDSLIYTSRVCEKFGLFGLCNEVNECSPCLETSISNPHFTDCCQPWFLPVVTCEDAYVDYVNYFTNNGAIPLANVKISESSNGLLSQEDFCNSNLNLYWDEYELYLNYITCPSLNTYNEDVIDQNELNPLYINLSEFAFLNFQDFASNYLTYIEGVISMEAGSTIDRCDLLENEFTYLNNGITPYIGFEDVPSLLTPAQFVDYNLLPDSMNAFLAQSTYDIYSWMESTTGFENLSYCPPILPSSTSFNIEFPTVDPCFGEFLVDLDTANITAEWQQIIDDYTNNFLSDFVDTAFTNIYEELEYSYVKNTYHKTLYYYDLAGNLAQTIPPKGVDEITYVQGGGSQYPTHTFNTQYKYNSFNQLIWQSTPDGGETYFYYDALGRLVASQNDEQNNPTPNKKYSYTIYDELGRISEVGVVSGSVFNSGYNVQMDIDSYRWPGGVSGVQRTEVVKTFYDASPASSTHLPNSLEQQNLRNRVAATATFTDYYSSFENYDQATFYSYDIHGNVKWVVQEIPEMASGDGAFKYMEYDYDLISGNVNKVSYQPGEIDQFYHKYEYDDDNRITEVYTSSDNIIWQNDARYLYYDHGPLARTELGENKVQGVDYFYTLQGWLKGVNTNNLTSSVSDLGQDNLPSGLNPYGSSDVYGFTLDYYTGDYSSINSSPGFDYSSSAPSSNLYNGNIKGMNVAITRPADDYTNPISTKLGSTSGQIPIEHQSYYTYDQLNRIRMMQEYTTSFKTEYSYDPNGNLLTLSRFDESGNEFDILDYSYPSTNNKLRKVDDSSIVSEDGTYGDISGNQIMDNYYYDDIGNLRTDTKEGINEIFWLANGKIREISKANVVGNVDSEFLYDAAGNRIAKKTKVWASSSSYNSSLAEKQYYVRDASGNVMATYKIYGSGSTLIAEDYSIFGSSRLGILSKDIDVSTNLSSTRTSFATGEKLYELSNHLGNVMETITDHKIAYTYSGNLRFGSEVTSMNDFYPFGMLMPNRHENSSQYRYGFNGMEKDDEIKGQGNSYDFGARIYDPRIGRWLSRDPKESQLPGINPYNYSFNNPILFIDPDGQFPMTPEETRIVLQAYMQAIEMYAIESAHEEFAKTVERFPEGNVLPSGINLEIKGLRDYDDRWILEWFTNDLDANVIVKIDDQEIMVNIEFKITEEGNYIITNLLGLGNASTMGTTNNDSKPISFINSKVIVGYMKFPDSEKGDQMYSALNDFRTLIYKSTIYQDAIDYDQANNIEYGDPMSQQSYYDANYPDYKESYETGYSIDTGQQEDGNSKVEVKYHKSDEKIEVPLNDF